eukprot:jgi/Ulvmu1/5607/UM023_0144.1
MLEDARTHCEAVTASMARDNSLARTSLSDNVADAHTKIQYMLKDGLGMLHARVLEVDHANKQLVSCGERTNSCFPLSARSIAATVVCTGKLKHLRNPVIDSEFNSSIDGSGGTGPVEDLLVFPVLAAASGGLGYRMGGTLDRAECHAAEGTSDASCAQVVIAVCLVSSKRRGLLGANDILQADELAAQVSFMLQRVHQIVDGKHAAAQLASVASVMQQLSLARRDPHRRQAVMNDLGRNLLAAEMVQLAPVQAVRTLEGWDCVPPNAKARDLTNAVLRLVETSRTVYEESRGDLGRQDDFFGTTIKPERLLGIPVWLQSGTMYGVIVVQRFSIEPFSKVEQQVLESVARRIGLQASCKDP